MFELTSQQKEAAKNAMNGTAPSSYLHIILYVIACIAMFWFFSVLVGAHQSLHSKHQDLGDVLREVSIATFFLICTAILIIY
jgi:amino acid permease